jgi:hypothetical protein
MREAAVAPAPSPLCEWTDASVKFALYLNPNLMPRLGIESWTAFKRVPRRGLEIGGILLGRTEIGENSIHLWIEGYRTVESEHRWGPSYLLSDGDFERLREEVRTSGPEAIGFFRTHTRSQEPSWEAPDSEVLRRCFGEGATLLMLLAPVPGKAAVFVPVQGELKCVHECPMASSLSAMLTLRQHNQPAVAHPEAERGIAKAIPALPPEPYGGDTIAVPEQSSPPPHPALREPRTLSAVAANGTSLIAAAIALLAFAGIADSVARSLHHETIEPSFLRLTVQPAGASLRLNWDPNAPSLKGAVQAILHVDDGDQTDERTLSAAELKSGMASYEPRSANVTFRLDVYPALPRSFGVIQVFSLPAAPAPAIKPPQPVTRDNPAPPYEVAEVVAKTAAKPKLPDLRGISAAPLSPLLRRRFHLPAGTSGVVVTAVQPASGAFEAVLQEGDVIQEVNRRPVAGVAEFEQAMQNAASTAVLLSVKRDGILSFHAVP